MSDTTSSFAQRGGEKRHFDHEDMDYYLSWIMGRDVYEGSNAEECLAVAERITDGDVDSWQREWQAQAEQTEQQAAAALDGGQTAVARGAYLRACTYYRAPLFMMKPDAPVFTSNEQKIEACFRQAAQLFESPIEPVQVTFEGHQLRGYFWSPDASGEARPTLVVFGGIETFAEDCYFMMGSAGPARGYNVLTVDLPGQGTTPRQDLHFGARMERPVAAVLDYALSRPEIDPEQLAVFGFSWGGHIVFKAGRYDDRVKAMIANPPMPNVFRSALAQQQGVDRSDPVAKVVFSQIAWRMGLKISLNPMDIARRIGKAYDYLVNGRVDPSQVPCPVLCLAGQGEAPVTLKIARECDEQLPHPQSRLVIFTQADGSEAHCQVDNLPLANSTIFDWLDSVFAQA